MECDKRILLGLTQAAFGQRRKMLRQSLKSGVAPLEVATALAAAGIEATKRAEEVDVAGFVGLAQALEKARR